MSRRFDFRTLTAQFDSVGTCGHAIKRGEQIGYARKRWGAAETQCAACWAAALLKWREVARKFRE